MPQPLLNLRNVRIVIESIGGGRRTQSVGAEPLDLLLCRIIESGDISYSVITHLEFRTRNFGLKIRRQ